MTRATSIVCYDAGARFDFHSHGLGEQILVLEGTLSDELGNYPAGTYLQNPPGSGHAPYSTHGCTLFVKLRYLDLADTERVVVDTRNARWHQGLVPGLKVLPLSAFGTRNTAILQWCGGRQRPTSTRTGTMAEKKYWWSRACSLTSTDIIRPEAGSVVRTSVSTNRSAQRAV